MNNDTMYIPEGRPSFIMIKTPVYYCLFCEKQTTKNTKHYIRIKSKKTGKFIQTCKFYTKNIRVGSLYDRWVDYYNFGEFYFNDLQKLFDSNEYYVRRELFPQFANRGGLTYGLSQWYFYDLNKEENEVI